MPAPHCARIDPDAELANPRQSNGNPNALMGSTASASSNRGARDPGELKALRDVSVLLIGPLGFTDQTLLRRLLASGYQVRVATTGMEAITMAHRRRPDLVILDDRLSDISPSRISTLLRCQHLALKIVVVSHGQDRCQIAAWLDQGVEACAGGSDAIPEILARVRRSLEQHDAPVRPARSMTIGMLHIDVEAHRATMGPNALDLTAREYRILLELAHRNGAITTYPHLLRTIWGEEETTPRRLAKLRGAVARVRQHIATFGPDPVITNLANVGYRLERPDKPHPTTTKPPVDTDDDDRDQNDA